VVSDFRRTDASPPQGVVHQAEVHHRAHRRRRL